MTDAARQACPVLTTARLTLGPHGLGDYEDSLALWSDPEVVRYMGGAPLPPTEIWGRQLRYAGLWPLMGYGYWVVRETTTGRFVGEVGFAENRRDLTPGLDGAPEAGWVLSPWAHGQGFAREATRAIFTWADGVLGAERTVCMIDPRNTPSLALAGKLGFEVFARSLYRNEAVVLLERFAANPSRH